MLPRSHVQAFLGIFIPVFDIIAFFFTFALTFLTLFDANYVIVKQLLFGQEHVIFNYYMNIFSYRLPTTIFHCVDIMDRIQCVPVLDTD